MNVMAPVLVTSDSSSDAELVENLLAKEFPQTVRCSEPSHFAREFDRVRPKVLVLAMRATRAAERHYLGILRHSGFARSRAHRTVLLCSKEETREAYQLCRQQYFDDYVVFWPIGYDAYRLVMSVHQAMHQMRAAEKHGDHTGVFALREHDMEERAERARTERPLGPDDESEPGTSPEETAAAGSSSDPVILLVDDDPLQHTLLKHALRGTPYRWQAVSSGREALDSLRRQVPDLVLMDYEMPDMDGVATIRAIRTELKLEQLPILMLTGHSTRQVAMTSLDAGARDFIVKPYQRAVLLEKIRSCLVGGRVADTARPSSGMA